MSKDIIQDIWNKGKAQKQELGIQEIEEALRPFTRRQSFSIRVYLWLWLAIMLGTFVLDVFNIVEYSVNPTMMVVQIGLTLLIVLFGIYGMYLLREVRIIDRVDESMLTMLKRLLRFYRTKFEIWNLMMGATIVLLTFAVTSHADNDNGHYEINNVGMFVLVSVLQAAFVYLINKVAQYPFRKEMNIIMSDLEANVTEGTQTIPGLRKHWRLWAAILFIIGTILLLLGIWRTLQFIS